MVVEQAAPQGQKKGRGCFFYGCLISFIMSIIVIVLLAIMIRRGIHAAIDNFTTEQPKAIPTVIVESSVSQNAQTKFAAILAGNFEKELSLSGLEFNALIATQPMFSMLKDRVFVAIDGNQLDIQFNTGLDIFGEIPFISYLGGDTHGRYVNGEVKGTFTFKGDEIVASTSALSLNGHTAPEDVLSRVNDYLKANRVIKEMTAEQKAALEKIDQITIQDGKLLIEPKVAK